MFWVCGETHQGSNEVARSWIVESERSPRAEKECLPNCMIYKQRGSGSRGSGGGCIPYPFNGMGGFVESGHETKEAAKVAEAALWDD